MQQKNKMESTNVRIEKLRDKDNWLQWRFIIRTLLEEDDDIINVCEGSLIRPVEYCIRHEIGLKSVDWAKTVLRFQMGDK